MVVSETDFLAVGAADRRRTALRADDGRRTAGLEKYRPDLSLVAGSAGAVEGRRAVGTEIPVPGVGAVVGKADAV